MNRPNKPVSQPSHPTTAKQIAGYIPSMMYRIMPTSHQPGQSLVAGRRPQSTVSCVAPFPLLSQTYTHTT